MGHLINPTGMRLGWFRNWVDVYFVEFRYYPEFLHALLRFRLYLDYFLKSKNFEKSALFLSHFQFVKIRKFLSAKIFIYDGRLESLWIVICDYFTNEISYLKSKKVKLSYRLGNFFFLLMSFTFFEKLPGFSLYPAHELENLALKFFDLDYDGVMNWLKEYRNSNFYILKRGMVSRLYLFFNFYLSLRSIIYKRHIKYQLRNQEIVRIIFYAFASSTWIKDLFSVIEQFLIFIFEFISSFKIKIDFYLIDNNSVTAKFLSRYIARRLRQKYTIRELISPLKRELKWVRSDYKCISRYVAFRISGIKKQRLSYLFNNSLFKRCFLFLFVNYRRYYTYYYLKFKSWFTYEIFILYYWLFKNVNIKEFYRIIHSNIKEYKSKLIYIKTRLVGLCRTYIMRRCYFLFFFNTERSRYYSSEFFIGLAGLDNIYLNFNKKPNFVNFFYEIFDDFYANFHVIFSLTNMDTNFRISSYYKAFILSSEQMSRFILYNLTKFKFRYSAFYGLLGLNKSKLRLYKPKRFCGLMGFKFHYKGRFSRKQIATSSWFRFGKVPLNTISAIIDYAFYTVPLKNSAVSIKIWLYKDKFYKYYNTKII